MKTINKESTAMMGPGCLVNSYITIQKLMAEDEPEAYINVFEQLVKRPNDLQS